eukprot:14703-Heterococcus_DN1.PRE.3
MSHDKGHLIVTLCRSTSALGSLPVRPSWSHREHFCNYMKCSCGGGAVSMPLAYSISECQLPLCDGFHANKSCSGACAASATRGDVMSSATNLPAHIEPAGASRDQAAAAEDNYDKLRELRVQQLSHTIAP